MIIKVKFNDIQEFKEELLARPPCDQIVRLTMQFSPTGMSPNIRYVSVIAGFLRDMAMDNMQLIELTKFVGDDWGGNFESTKKTHERAELIMKDLTNFCKAHGWEVRAGMFVMEEPKK